MREQIEILSTEQTADNRPLTDAELNGVSGGAWGDGGISSGPYGNGYNIPYFFSTPDTQLRTWAAFLGGGGTY